MKVVAFNGSPRRNGNTTYMLHTLLRGAEAAGAQTEEIIAEALNLKYCRGCLRCNILKHCAIKDDDWPVLSQKILDADCIVFASPIYFHHLTASLKKVLDRFRSFVHVRMTEDGLVHTPWHHWSKKIILLLCMGSSQDSDARPVIDLFAFMTQMLGAENTLTEIIGTRLAIARQIDMTEHALTALYKKLFLPALLAENDFIRNKGLLNKCYETGRRLGKA
jgi:multimeric flavodoxin WrbA